MAEIVITYDGRSAWNAAFRAALRDGLMQCGSRCEDHAKEKCPVDTGRLRGSIQHHMEGDKTVVISTNVEYAPYVELGTSRMKAQPFLKPAATNHISEYQSILRSRLGK